MGTIDGMLLEIESFTKNANIAKSIVLSRLLEDKIITDEQRTEYLDNWQIIVIKKSWFKKLLSKDNDWEYRFVNINT